MIQPRFYWFIVLRSFQPIRVTAILSMGFCGLAFVGCASMDRSLKILKPNDSKPDVEVTVTVKVPVTSERVATYPVVAESADVTTAFASLQHSRDSLPTPTTAAVTAQVSNTDIDSESQQPRGGWSEERRLW